MIAGISDSERYARCVQTSKRVRWDIEKDLIRGPRFAAADSILKPRPMQVISRRHAAAKGTRIPAVFLEDQPARCVCRHEPWRHMRARLSALARRVLQLDEREEQDEMPQGATAFEDLTLPLTPSVSR
jgi:hypothetical protein